MNRDMLSRRLERRGYEVIVAVDGEEGVARAKADGPDVVLMDLSLPGIDGWEATRQLKAADETRSIPVLALTAHAMAGDREKALAAGCDDFDTKPVDLPRLVDKIEAPAGRRVSDRVGRPAGCGTNCSTRSTTSSATPNCSSRTEGDPRLADIVAAGKQVMSAVQRILGADAADGFDPAELRRGAPGPARRRDVGSPETSTRGAIPTPSASSARSPPPPGGPPSWPAERRHDRRRTRSPATAAGPATEATGASSSSSTTTRPTGRSSPGASAGSATPFGRRRTAGSPSSSWPASRSTSSSSTSTCPSSTATRCSRPATTTRRCATSPPS